MTTRRAAMREHALAARAARTSSAARFHVGLAILLRDFPEYDPIREEDARIRQRRIDHGLSPDVEIVGDRGWRRVKPSDGKANA